MDFEEFQKRMVQEIRKNLPKEYSDAEIETIKVNKINRTYTGLIIRTNNDGAAPALDLNSLYKLYQNGENLDNLIKEVIRKATSSAESIKCEYINEYKSVKNRLFVRVSNAERNKELLQTVPHKTTGDIAMTYHILIEERNGVLASATISNDLFRSYGVTAEQLHNDCLENAQQLFPVCIKTFGDMLSPGEQHNKKADSYLIVTNRSAVNGAAVMFYPDVMENIAERIDSSFFIIPSSIHEMIVVPDDGHSDYHYLEETLRNANESVVSDEEQLSNTLYHYDSKHDLLETCEEFEKRLDIEYNEISEELELLRAEDPFLSKHNQSI